MACNAGELYYNSAIYVNTKIWIIWIEWEICFHHTACNWFAVQTLIFLPQDPGSSRVCVKCFSLGDISRKVAKGLLKPQRKTTNKTLPRGKSVSTPFSVPRSCIVCPWSGRNEVRVRSQAQLIRQSIEITGPISVHKQS